MKKLLSLTVLLTALAGRAALPQPDLIAQIHFAGGSKISADKNYPAFTNEFSSAEALALRKQTADKLAPWLAGWLQQQAGATVPDGAAKLRPLLDDLQAGEWFLEARAAANDKPDVALAIKLGPARRQFWQASLKPFFPAATFTLSADWFIFDSGTGAAKAGDSLAKTLSAPATGWLNVDVNWPHLAQWYPEIKELDLPETLFNVTAPDANLHIDGKFFFPANLLLKLDPWQFPTNTMHQPFVSFTAARGFAGWLSGQDWAQPLKLSPAANQVFFWALNGMAFQSYAAVPVPDSASALGQLIPGLQSIVAERDAQNGFIAPARLKETNNQVTLAGLPFITPYIKAVSEPGGQFLLAGGFPNTVKSAPLPPGMFQGLNVPNLVFYHWENTAARLPLLLNLSQLSLVLTRHKQLDADSAGAKWVSKISPALGSTLTEIRQTSLDQFTFSRQAPGGLTALELIGLANWLGAADFPHCNLDLPPLSELMKKNRNRNQQPPAPQIISIPNQTQPH